jgi:CcmD family protein
MSQLYWVLAASAVIWIGLFAYLIYVERRIRELERRL